MGTWRISRRLHRWRASGNGLVKAKAQTMRCIKIDGWNIMGNNEEKIKFVIPIKNISIDKAKKILKELSLEYKDSLIFGDSEPPLEKNK